MLPAVAQLSVGGKRKTVGGKVGEEAENNEGIFELGKRRRAVQQQQQRGEEVVVVLDECRKGGWIGRIRGEANGSPTGVSRCAACGNRDGKSKDSRIQRRLGKRRIEVQQQKRKLKMLLLYCLLIDVQPRREARGMLQESS